MLWVSGGRLRLCWLCRFSLRFRSLVTLYFSSHFSSRWWRWNCWWSWCTVYKRCRYFAVNTFCCCNCLSLLLSSSWVFSSSRATFDCAVQTLCLPTSFRDDEAPVFFFASLRLLTCSSHFCACFSVHFSAAFSRSFFSFFQHFIFIPKGFIHH